MTIKIRKVGNSQTLTVPKNFNIDSNTTYKVTLKNDETNVYKPENLNHFEDDWFNENLNQKEIFSDVNFLYSEWNN